MASEAPTESWRQTDYEATLEAMGSSASLVRMVRNIEKALFAMLYCLVKDNLFYKKLTFGAIILEWVQVCLVVKRIYCKFSCHPRVSFYLVYGLCLLTR